MASIKDVAKRAGVSISTVSYVISGKRSVKDATKIRVMKAARELGYFPNAGARMLRGENTHIIALSSPIHPYTNSSNYAAFFFEVVKAARRYRYDVLLLAGEEEDAQLDRMADSRLVDGVILLDVAWDDDRIEKARLSRVPYISIGIPKDTSRLTAVDLDCAKMGEIAVERLANAGHTHVLFIGADQSVDSKSKEKTESNYLHRIKKAIVSTARRRKIDVSITTSAGDDIASVGALVEKAFAHDPAISSIVTQVSMEYLNNLITVLSRKGLKIPDDVSVISLTTNGKANLLPVPVDEMPLMPAKVCLRAIEIFVGILSGEIQEEQHVELLTPTYIDRGSVRVRAVASESAAA
jgi:DNA-binding LacI/PurR family transcriptional regulator